MDSTKLAEIKAVQAAEALSSTRHQELLGHTDNVAQTVLTATSALIKYLEGHTSKTEVVNQLESISTPDVKYVVEALQVLDATLKTHENTDLTEITGVMRELLAEAKQIPKALPDSPEIPQPIDYTKQLSSLADAIKAVEKVVKAQKLVAEAPIVNVDAPNVNVDAPDLKPLQSGIKDVVKAVNGIVIPEFKTDNTAVEKLLKESNKLLDKILSKPVGGGGGGGSSWPALGTNGLPAPLNLDASGNLKVTGGGGGGSGTQYADGDARGTATGTLVMGDDGTNIQSIKAQPLNQQVVASDTGLVVHAVLHGLTTAGGGGYVDVKANPSGTLETGANLKVGGSDVSNSAPVPISDAGGSVTVDGTFWQTQPTTETSSNVANSVTNQTALALNTSRRMATFYNDDTAASVYLKCGATASATSFKVKIAPGGYYELPQPVYTGRIDVLATAATGTLRVTETT